MSNSIAKGLKEGHTDRERRDEANAVLGPTEQTGRYYVVFGVLNHCFSCLPTALRHKTLDIRVTCVTR